MPGPELPPIATVVPQQGAALPHGPGAVRRHAADRHEPFLVRVMRRLLPGAAGPPKRRLPVRVPECGARPGEERPGETLQGRAGDATTRLSMVDVAFVVGQPDVTRRGHQHGA